MMGAYRLLLAVLVALSHAGMKVADYNPGVVAVISFFILSGYVMSLLICRYYSSDHSIVYFYMDRAARLFPHYIFYLILAVLVVIYTPLQNSFVSGLNVIKGVLNLFILPLGYYMFGLQDGLIIPQAWSLGLELSFYLIVPFLLLYLPLRRWMPILATVSFAVFVLAFFGILNTDWFGYRLLPGTLFIFMVGMAMSERDVLSAWYPFVVFVAAAGLLIFAYISPQYFALPYNKEVLLGILIGISALVCLRNVAYSKLDEFLGNISYGLFLNHFIVIWVMGGMLGYSVPLTNSQATIMIFVSALCSCISYMLIEVPALRIRRKLRRVVASKE